MYCAAYKFQVLPDIENGDERFITAWSGITEFFRDECGALGSRLHKGADGAFYAYAQWPDKATHDASGNVEATQAFMKHGVEWSEICAPSEVLFEGDVTTDMFV
ncbi:MAG: hypothetical protein ACPGVT_00495 [Maricaulaceae bacterium]